MRRIYLRAFNSKRFDRLRLLLIGYALRLPLLLGYTVLLTGDTRSGKTQILSTLTPGRIIDGWEKSNRSAKAYGIHFDALPRSAFSFDEVQCFDRSALEEVLCRLAKSNHAFVMAMNSTVSAEFGQQLLSHWASAQARKLSDTKLLHVALLPQRTRRYPPPVEFADQ